MFSFHTIAHDGKARAGRLMTPHGSIETPCFIPVGTLATVKSMSPEDLHRVKSQILIANTYHLHLQPGEDRIEKLGGLHAFMGWEGPLMTDSGGFQIFSQGAAKEHGVGKIASIFPEGQDRGRHLSSKKGEPLVRVDEDGVEFISYLDGSRHRFTPEKVIEIGRKLGADILLVLDECTSPLHDYDYTKKAMERTHRWALRSLDRFQKTSDKSQALFGIVQGGAYRNLREKSASFIAEKNFQGIAVGGSLGMSKDDMYSILEWTVPLLPEDKPRHLLGIGEIDDIFEAAECGMDLFDCVTPTRMAGTGTLFNRSEQRFRMHILNARFKNDPGPIESGCNCYTCRNHSRAYLRHLFMAREILAVHLAAIHNLHFMETLMCRIRSAIREGELGNLKKKW